MTGYSSVKTTLPLAPAFLGADDYQDIERLMLEGRRHTARSAACDITPGGNPMLVDLSLDRSFAGQIGSLLYEPETIINGTVPCQPDAYLCTEKSAVPLADALRGVYEGLCLTTPTISTIAANSAISRQYLREDLPEEGKRQEQKLFDAETQKVAKVVGGANHVCVVDQFVDTGKTVRYAGLILRSVGVSTITVLQGRWYRQTAHSDVHSTRVTSAHRRFMHRVGVKTAELIGS